MFDEKARAYGVIRNDKLIAAVVYNEFRLKPDQSPLSIEISINSIDKRWASRQNLRTFFAYPFIQLALERVQTTCSASDEGVMQFNRKLGFVPEGYHRQGWPLGGDAVSWSMLKPECRWL